jgi:hypothetical protein
MSAKATPDFEWANVKLFYCIFQRSKACNKTTSLYDEPGRRFDWNKWSVVQQIQGITAFRAHKNAPNIRRILMVQDPY